MKLHSLSLVLAIILFISCSTKKEANISGSDPHTPTTTDSNIKSSSVLDDPDLESGIILEAEEAGYPVVSLTINFPKRNWQEHFNLNVEEFKGLNYQHVLNSIGKTVAIAFKSESTAAVIDLLSDGKSILLNPAPNTTKQLKRITGVLSGADNITPGDLPDTLHITSNENEEIRFQYFITPEIVRYNGKRLTALYAQRVYNKVLKFNMTE